MRTLSVSLAATAAALLTLGVGARADTHFFANLDTASERPTQPIPTLTLANGGGPRPLPFGTATFTLNDTMTAMTFSATVFNIDFTGTQTADPNDNLTNAHIHAAAAFSPTGTLGVAWGFQGTPFNETAPNDRVFTPFTNGVVGGTISGKWDPTEGNGTTLAAQLPNIFAGRAYINFHTIQFGSGEIRGNLAFADIPEPGTVALMAGGGALPLLGLLRRRRS